MSNLRRLLIRAATLVLFGLLIASFALWGVGDIFRSGGGGRVVARVGETEITARDFQRRLQRRLEQLRRRTGSQIDMETAKQMGLVDRVVRRSITRALFNAEANRLGLAVGDEQVARRISQKQVFQTDGGGFSRKRFQRVLQRGGLSEEAYINRVRGQLKRRAIGDVVGAGVQVPTVMAKHEYRYRNEARIADHIVLDTKTFDVEQPKKQKLKSYYEQNTDAFMAPEYREVTFVHVTPKKLTGRVKVSEEALRAAYKERKERFTKPERRKVRQIVLDTKAKAQRALDLLKQGRSFQAVGEKVAGGPPADLGKVTRSALPGPLADAVFGLEKGNVTKPVKTALGWHLARVTAIDPADNKSFEAVRDKLRADLARDKAADRLIRMVDDMRDALASGAKLAAVAKQFGLDVHHVPALDKKGRNKAGEPIETLPPGPKFLDVAFSTAVNQRSLLKETKQGGYFVLRVDSTTPSKPRPFESVRDTVRERILDKRRTKAAKQAARAMVKALDNGESLAALAEKYDAQVRSTHPLTRSGNRDATPVGRALAGPIFDVAKGKATMASMDDRVVVARVSEIKPARPAKNPEAMNKLRRQLAKGLRSDLFAQFADSLRQRVDVRVNQDAIDRIVAGVR